MTPSDTPANLAEPTPHPLATELAARLTGLIAPRVLLLGIGSGRNVPPLVAAGSDVDAIEEDPERADLALDRFRGVEPIRIARASYAGPYQFAGPFSAALSTHALLHGSPSEIRAALRAVRSVLNPSAPFFFTLGSTADPRFGSGARVGPNTFVLDTGSEAGVPHCYFDGPGIAALLPGFEIEALDEHAAAETVGTWAHAPTEAATMIHWFVRVRRA